MKWLLVLITSTGAHNFELSTHTYRSLAACEQAASLALLALALDLTAKPLARCIAKPS